MTPMTSLEMLRTLAPEFSELSDETVEKWLELSAPLLSSKKFGSIHTQAVVLLTAHRLKMAGYGDNSTGTIGQTLRVGSYSEGSTSIGYNTGQQTNLMPDAELTLTSYGLQYLTLRRTRISSIVSSGEGG